MHTADLERAKVIPFFLKEKIFSQGFFSVHPKNSPPAASFSKFAFLSSVLRKDTIHLHSLVIYICSMTHRRLLWEQAIHIHFHIQQQSPLDIQVTLPNSSKWKDLCPISALSAFLHSSPKTFQGTLQFHLRVLNDILKLLQDSLLPFLLDIQFFIITSFNFNKLRMPV